MNAAAHLVEAAPPARMAFRLQPATVRALLPPQQVGTYLLLAEEQPIYVGRSDTCLRTRLTTHNHADAATHVLWEIVGTPVVAFHLEAYWWHRFKYRLLNVIHPAAPAGHRSGCPFCRSETQALQYALNRPHTVTTGK